MSTILRNFTPEQNYELMRNKVIADNVGLTNFNEGSDARSILEAVGIIASTLGFDFLEGLRQSIPVALFDGLNFNKNPATGSTGFLRFYRLPIFYIVYTGLDTDVELDITLTELTLTTSGTPGDDVTVDFATYTTIDAIVAEIDSKTNWSATKIQDGNVSSLYLYSAKQIIGNYNYLDLGNSADILSTGASLVTIPANAQASIDSIIIQTTIGSSILAGNATSAYVSAISIQTGKETNIEIRAIDTINGKGILNTYVAGVEHVVNDSAFLNGEDEETDEERATRFQLYVQGLTVGTKKGIEAAILEIPEIKSVTLRERYPIAGTNTITADDGSGNLTVDMIDNIREIIEGNPDDLINYPGAGVAGINYNIEPPDVIDQNITGTLYRVGTASDSNEIELAARSAIEAYVNTRRLGDDLVLSELIKRTKGSHPSIYDVTFSVPASNVSVGLNQIVRTGGGSLGVITLTLVTLTSLP